LGDIFTGVASRIFLLKTQDKKPTLRINKKEFTKEENRVWVVKGKKGTMR
jgi:hypothetical protein